MPLDPFLQQSQENVHLAQAALRPGQKMFGGRFVLERHLGLGGMGQVWLAQDTALEQPRALKFVLPALLSDAQARKRLRNEARLGTELAHPRIVRVFDFVEETDGSPLAAVVMEFVEGRTLADLQAAKDIGFFEPEEIERWVQDVIEGLRYAHEEKQRFHLDLKPGNIMVETATGRAKVLDFGISRSAKDTMTRLTGQVSSGTLPYMSPQQLDGEPPCAADDVYGLGATVYELLTGTPPFFRGKLEDQIRNKVPELIMERRRQNVREGLNPIIGDEVSIPWSSRLACMLDKAPARRRWNSFFPDTSAEVCQAPTRSFHFAVATIMLILAVIVIGTTFLVKNQDQEIPAKVIDLEKPISTAPIDPVKKQDQTTSDKVIDLGKPIPTTPIDPVKKQLGGLATLAKIIEVQHEQSFAVINAGKNKHLEKGMKFDVRRNDDLVGRVIINETVEEQESVVDIDVSAIFPGMRIEVGDELIVPASK